jgi:hypothetical protein
MLSPENQSALLECACSILKAETSTKKSADCGLGHGEKIPEEGGAKIE